MYDDPTKEDLDLIKNYDILEEGPGELINILIDLWAWKNYIIVKDNILEIHTGGWSGHEMIIDVLQDTLFWRVYWLKSERGGHYYFDLNSLRK